MAWHGMAWHGMAWHGMAWHGMAWQFYAQHNAPKRWSALIRYAYYGRLPMGNNRIANQIRPWAIGRKNWLFSDSLAAGPRAADIMMFDPVGQDEWH